MTAKATFYYKFDFDAWDEGTVCLSLEEEGAYLRICNNLYRRRGCFPNNEALLCQIWRCHPNKARKLLKALLEAGKITIEDGYIVNGRATRELAERGALSEARAEIGRRGGIKSGESRRYSTLPESDGLGVTPPAPGTYPEHTPPVHEGSCPSDPQAIAPNVLLFQAPTEAVASSKRSIEEKSREDIPLSSTDDKGRGVRRKPEHDLFDRGKEVFGGSSGGFINQILQHAEGEVALARSWIELASTKHDPKAWIGGMMRAGRLGRAPPQKRRVPDV